MEINQLADVFGVIPVEDIVEGRFVLLTTQTFTNNFGTRHDVPGVKLPDNAGESKLARFILGWAMDNRPTPLLINIPATTFALRQGYDKAANVPFAATVYLTQRSTQLGLTIASGEFGLAFKGGVFTIPSGGYSYSADLLVPGCPLMVMNTDDDAAGDAGKLKYGGFDPIYTVANVVEFDHTTADLTFRMAY